MVKLQARTHVTATLSNAKRFPIDEAELKIDELPLHAIVRVQGRSNDRAFRAGCADVFGTALPDAEQTSALAHGRLAWVTPNEWLYFGPIEQESAVTGSLATAFHGLFATVTKLSDARVAFVVQGRRAAEFLAKGSGIDFASHAFPVGRAVTTRFAGIAAMIIRLAPLEYALYFDVSLAGFLLDWLIDSAAEFATPAHL
ncbi:heterotetrameric sarcosine oxidase gamma subunit [Paraburkholderia caballeronis]|uniref:sarcosine oxidase subunit gamma n=1 Tax=Paraburkholderia caballeronis TaxID=416943 RepID=UPI0010E6FCB8|nr:sarcosine oxidase subunit gamma family protein [Paraburkholderia caballeronis]TDV33846.1 heterotetrameric sarcosine oxidase gamma subunit [Paraburkholderia caballeronis]